MEAASALRSLLGLAVVAAVLTTLSFVLRALGARRLLAAPGGRFLRVLESSALGNGAALHLVRVGERYFVLTTGSGHASAVCEVEAAALDAWRTAKSVGGTPKQRR